MAQASLFAMRERLEPLPKLDMISLNDPQANDAVFSTSSASLIKREYDKLSLAHQSGAATEYQIQK
eukprot:5418683-Karenia_brevis.AAC.1